MSSFELTLNRKVLKAAIMGHHTFSCAYTGKGLDIRRSVLILVDIAGGKRCSEVMDGEAFDVRWPWSTVERLMEGQPDGSTFEVWDGRALSSRSPGRQEDGYSKFQTGENVVPRQTETLF